MAAHLSLCAILITHPLAIKRSPESCLTCDFYSRVSRSAQISINMTSTSIHEVHKCSKCSKTASLTCKACKAMPNATDGQISSTWYCGSECQKADWIEHKPQCKASQARQALYRAAVTAKEIFYIYQKKTFMWAPKKFEKIGTTWLILPNVHTSTSQLVPFPYQNFPDVHDQEALLTYQSCNTAVSEMHNVVKTFLVGKSSCLSRPRRQEGF